MRILCKAIMLLGAWCVAHPLAAAPPVVTVETGALRGSTYGGIAVFKNVPFAAPPAGDLRWRAPQPPASWTGVRDATSVGPRCPQEDAFATHAPGPMSEDCLYLNLWVPADGEKLPVMVWIHGGGYARGSGTMSLYDGRGLAGHGVILITINYRLGRLGFFAHPALKAERDANYPYEPLGMYGILDQIAALKWVKRNIAAFGGDPDNVTVFGESAGGGSVSYLMVSPLAKGLFARAISQSGGGGAFLETHMERSAPGRPSAMLMARAFLKSEGLPDLMDASSLRSLPVEKLLKPQLGGSWPFVDGMVVPDMVGKMFADGRQHAVPFLMGANSLESQMTGDPSEALAHITQEIPREQLEVLYGQRLERSYVEQWFGDKRFLAPAKYLAATMDNAGGGAGAPAYLYYMSYQARTLRDEFIGVRHADELPFVFKTLKKMVSGAVAADFKVSTMMATYWTNFAKTGNPNGPGLPRWDAYRAADDNWFEIGDAVRPKPGHLAARLDWHIAAAKKSAGIP